VPSNQLEDSPGVGTAIIAICIVVVFVLVGLCAVALYVRRRRSAKKQNDARAHAVQFQVVHNGSGSYLMTSHNGLRGNSNTYMGTNSLTCDDAMALGIDNPYERLFQDVDTRLRIAQDDLRFDTEVGRGNFGVVNKATYTPANGVERKVACKMLRPGISGVTEFLKEGLIMENFKHPRVMPLIGISFTTDNFAPIIVTEFMANGDLVKYLRDANNTPTLRQLLNFAVQIAEGMQYLHKCKFIHRDLAARNCMLDGQLQIKIADFGLCRPVSKYESYEPMHRNRDMPLRWLSIEALEREEFTFKGDVWAYGVVLWELMTRGAIPYTGMQGYMLIDFLKNGQRLERPPYCPAQLYDSVMKKCWQAHPADRPTFADLVVSVPAIISALERSQASQSQLNAHYEPVSFGANASANSATSTSAGSSPSNITSV
uniref:Protein kinase domain-containing protein n=1 Tax=Plectus sambesii TaxID=2011161 RepID=A0A914XTE0_9BILA